MLRHYHMSVTENFSHKIDKDLIKRRYFYDCLVVPSGQPIMVGVTPISKSYPILTKPSVQPEISGFVYLLASMAVIGGFLFGYDTGIVSSAMLFVGNNQGMRPMTHFWQELIVAITPGAAALGSLFAGTCGDRYGRKKLIIISSFIFMIGALVCGAAVNKIILVFGRILLGIAIGVASMIVPVYVGECSPAHVRGKLLTGFNMMVCFGQMASNIVAAGFSYIDDDNWGWRLMFGFAAVPAVIQFVGFFFLPESPRWLYNHVGEKESRAVWMKVYGDDEWVNYELQEIAAINAVSHTEPDQSVFSKIIRTTHLRKALLIGCSLQLFQQLAGINTIMYYTGALVKSTGIKDNHKTIWVSCVISFVNFIGNLIPFLVVERIGRRKALLSSTLTVSLALAALGTAFLMVNRDTMATTGYGEMERIVGRKVPLDGDQWLAEHCLALSNCDFCVTDDRCGFCTPLTVAKVGVCLPLDPLHPDIQSSTGFCKSSIKDNSTIAFDWSDLVCETKFTMAPLALMVVYLLFFSAGFAPIPWVLNAEFYPLWARGTCVSITTFVNWSANLVISLTFLSLTNVLSRFGTFYLYSVIALIAFLIFKKFVPETMNCSLDEIEQLFMAAETRSVMVENMKASFETMRTTKYKDGEDTRNTGSYPIYDH
ncbi:unnamed protein product [Bursaphelenchus xylophilus]|uniref:(pine wood nematode) hypothetical protein n=1 Tax=Bursaphelenchus xylophilus TaxID=6326 RepID=A0A1I7RJJ0_BURXY|nr:unnamed protein product [Bursaphelenchus xylophilus]CAG9128913.1 unnamed protein product [Bursaphelenchus xylophilus]